MDEEGPPLRPKKKDLTDPPKGTDRQHLTKADFLKEIASDIDPAKYAGEGFYATEEYPTTKGIASAFTRGDVGNEGFYYPGPEKKGARPRKTP